MASKLPPKKITSWSFSRYSMYVQCAFKAFLVFIKKEKEPKNDAMERGNQIHEAAEHFIKGLIARVPAELKLVADDLKRLRKLFKDRLKLGLKGMAPVVEEQWCWTKEWVETQWDNWNYVWVRVKIDVGWWETETRFRVRDWKTGKFREDKNNEYLEQLELYALAVLLKFEHCQEVVPDLSYVDQGIIYPPEDEPMIFTRKDIPRLKKLWEKRVKPLLNDVKFAPRPNQFCPGCYFNSSTTYGFGKNKKSKPAGPCKF